MIGTGPEADMWSATKLQVNRERDSGWGGFKGSHAAGIGTLLQHETCTGRRGADPHACRWWRVAMYGNKHRAGSVSGSRDNRSQG